MDENTFVKSTLNTVKRLPKRGHYDKDTIYQILDQQFICHLAWEDQGQPYMIPTAYGRREDTLYVHGSSKSRMLSALTDGRPLCLVVTLLDGLVLARSVFHHSMNYRSAVIYGHAREIEGDEKMEALRIISDQILAGRWDEVRPPNELEMKATTVLAIEIDTASAKIRTGPPGDDDADYDLPIWAGVLPMSVTYHDPIEDPAMRFKLSVSTSVSSKFKQ
ncbi:MAG: pyridoxamine 5'-phosphate oxidase family protein [Saprospiraceae bacterium]|nr:pyridoxamine 5'-phosphate oxidase family protein [Candidatus Opimibacter iunctus]